MTCDLVSERGGGYATLQPPGRQAARSRYSDSDVRSLTLDRRRTTPEEARRRKDEDDSRRREKLVCASLSCLRPDGMRRSSRIFPFFFARIFLSLCSLILFLFIPALCFFSCISVYVAPIPLLLLFHSSCPSFAFLSLHPGLAFLHCSSPVFRLLPPLFFFTFLYLLSRFILCSDLFSFHCFYPYFHLLPFCSSWLYFPPLLSYSLFLCLLHPRLFFHSPLISTQILFSTRIYSLLRFILIPFLLSLLILPSVLFIPALSSTSSYILQHPIVIPNHLLNKISSHHSPISISHTALFLPCPRAECNPINT